MELRDVLDGLGSDDFGDDAAARSRARVLAGIAAAPPTASPRRRTVRERWHWSGGLIAAVAAVVVVALVAVGAVLSAQWLGSAPPPTAGDPQTLDLSAPLPQQLGPGEYLRIATTRESSYTDALPKVDGGGPVADAYLRVRTVDVLYVPAGSGPWTGVTSEESPELVGPGGGADAAALAAQGAWREETEVFEWPESLGVSAQRLADLPEDGLVLIGALSEGRGVPGGDAEVAAQLLLTDPVLLLITPEQRRAFLGALAAFETFTVTADGDETVVTALPFPSSAEHTGVTDPTTVVFVGPAALPLRGAVDTNPSQTPDFIELPIDEWEVDLSIVSSAPDVVVDEPEQPAAGPDGYWCAYRHIPQAVVDDPVYAEDLDADGIAALVEAAIWPTIEQMPRAWIVVSASEGDMLLFTDQLTMQAGWLLEGAPPDHQIAELYREGGSWTVGNESLCALQRDLGALALADVELDPAHPPRAGDEEVHFLVTERDCNSGQPADGRVELESGYYDSVVMEVTIGVRPTGEPATCPGNPPTSFVFELKTPWVEGTVVRDMTYVDPRELPMP